ncbi:hypothetical protein VNI00_006669 [Paramarasmius palmivorus]|uniref:AB hydrolase-1 domain-containing protein n=1 Tax=Paramarasmius palmivorus TaxID=297713 RepID=A0AAW0D7E1_9AGAR
MPAFRADAIVIETPASNGLPSLKMVSKRYTPTTSKAPDSSRDVSLVVMHGLGLNKEQWEPVVEKLWIHAKANAQNYRICEIWAPEWQSHGESGILNRSVIETNNVKGLVVSVWGLGLAALLKQPYLRGKRVIGVGFSIGNLALLNALREFSKSAPPVIGLVILEPILFDRETSSPENPRSQAVVNIMMKGIKSQGECWPDREQAKKYLTKRLPWSRWDASVLDKYLTFGLMDTTDTAGSSVVKTICSRAEEASAYENYVDAWSALATVEELSPIIPIHVVFGTEDRLIPRAWKNCAIDASKGRKIAGVHEIVASHMIPHEKPEELAILLAQLIQGMMADLRSKL